MGNSKSKNNNKCEYPPPYTSANLISNMRQNSKTANITDEQFIQPILDLIKEEIDNCNSIKLINVPPRYIHDKYCRNFDIRGKNPNYKSCIYDCGSLYVEKKFFDIFAKILQKPEYNVIMEIIYAIASKVIYDDNCIITNDGLRVVKITLTLCN